VPRGVILLQDLDDRLLVRLALHDDARQAYEHRALDGKIEKNKNKPEISFGHSVHAFYLPNSEMYSPVFFSAQ
jgi:hypothetical protein